MKKGKTDQEKKVTLYKRGKANLHCGAWDDVEAVSAHSKHD